MWDYQNVFPWVFPKRLESALALNINFGSNFHPAPFTRLPYSLLIFHSVFIKCLSIPGITPPAWERMPTKQGRKCLSPWSLPSSRDVSYRCNKWSPNLATSNNTYLLSQSFWGLAGGLWFKVARVQSVIWGCRHLKERTWLIHGAVYRSQVLLAVGQRH